MCRQGHQVDAQPVISACRLVSLLSRPAPPSPCWFRCLEGDNAMCVARGQRLRFSFSPLPLPLPPHPFQVKLRTDKTAPSAWRGRGRNLPFLALLPDLRPPTRPFPPSRRFKIKLRTDNAIRVVRARAALSSPCSLPSGLPPPQVQDQATHEQRYKGGTSKVALLEGRGAEAAEGQGGCHQALAAPFPPLQPLPSPPYRFKIKLRSDNAIRVARARSHYWKGAEVKWLRAKEAEIRRQQRDFRQKLAWIMAKRARWGGVLGGSMVGGLVVGRGLSAEQG
ncbi:unnamed protein product [Closterium sp. Naga37s-1]|nr:unnamed protein product [Closterium sp. Naga37s-1]